jgi:hypothetical protein
LPNAATAGAGPGVPSAAPVALEKNVAPIDSRTLVSSEATVTRADRSQDATGWIFCGENDGNGISRPRAKVAKSNR